MPRLWLFERTAVKLALSVTLVVVCALGLGLYGLAERHHRTQIEAWHRAAESRARLIRLALEHQMINNDRSLIRDMVNSFAGDPGARRVLLLDHEGCVRFSSDPQLVGHVFSRDSEACAPCHVEDPRVRRRFVVLGPEDNRVLRTVQPIENREICHQCHGADHKINGVLILDKPIGELEAELKRELLWLTGGTGLLALFLLVGIGITMRGLIFSRLSKLAAAARAIATGDLRRRVEVGGTDEIATLGAEFNNMAASVSGLIEDVRYHQDRLENVMNSVDDGLVVLDRDLTIIASNHSFARRFGLPREALLNRRCLEITGPAYDCRPDSACCPSRRCFDTGRLDKGTLYRSAGADGERIEEVHASPIFDREGTIQQVVEIWRDITERRREEARLAEFHRLASVGMLASGYSHEMNTPLASMLACVETIFRRSREGAPLEAATQAEILEHAATIRAEILRCKKITGQFLKFSMSKSLSLDLVDVAGVIDAVVPLVSPTARAEGVSVVVAKQGPMPTILANEGALQHVLLNLLLNAIQASPKGQRVVVSCEQARDVRIRVQDHGRGIAAEDLKRIFEPFFSKRRGGTGLGLFLSRVMARSWGGDVRVESAIGVGSSFEIVCPLPEDDQP